MRFRELLQLNKKDVKSFPAKNMYPVIPMDEPMRNINWITTEGKEKSFGDLIDNGIIPSEARAEKGILYYHELFSINKVFDTELLLTTHGFVTRNPRNEGSYLFMPYGSFSEVQILQDNTPRENDLGPQPLIRLIGENQTIDIGSRYLEGTQPFVKSEEIECLYFILIHFYEGLKETQHTIELDTSKIIYLESSSPDAENQESKNLDTMIDAFLEEVNKGAESNNNANKTTKERSSSGETAIEKIIKEWESEGMIEISKKDFIHHLAIIYPEMTENTIKTMITTMIVNKRTRTYYHGCKKPRKCSPDNKYDFFYIDENNFLSRYNEEQHGKWEIYEREDKKLDTRLI